MTLWEAGDPTIEGSDDPTSTDQGVSDEQPTTWTVAELGAEISASLKKRFPTDVWVSGEIRSCRAPNKNGHQYFDLVEPGNDPGEQPKAKLSVTLFGGRRRSINADLAASGSDLQLADGVEVRIRGSIDWWTAGGKLNFIMSAIDPVFTLGQLDAQRRALIGALTAEGLLRRNAQLIVPPLPLRIGLVTSAGSAAHADFINELTSSRYRFDVVLADARVQGAEAIPTVCLALEKVARGAPDVIALVRGGGSRTDLIAFDHERIARAIANCPIPVFTGIGHEIDRSIADEVAHHSFKTPTAVAANIVDRVSACESALDDSTVRFGHLVTHRLTNAQNQLDVRWQRVFRAAQVADARAGAHLLALQRQLVTTARQRLTGARRSVEATQARLVSTVPGKLDRMSERLDAAAARANAYDPERVLARGWSLTRTKDGTLVRGPDQVTPGDQLVTTIAGGTITSTITDAKPEDVTP